MEKMDIDAQGCEKTDAKSKYYIDELVEKKEFLVPSRMENVSERKFAQIIEANSTMLDKIIYKMHLEDKIASYPIKLLNISQLLAMKDGSKSTFADITSRDVASVLKDKEYRGSEGVSLIDQNELIIGNIQHVQRALRSEKHEFSHLFINNILTLRERSSLFKAFDKVVEEIIPELKKYYPTSWEKGGRYLKNEVFGRVIQNKNSYSDKLLNLEEYIVETSALILYLDQHRNKNPEYEKQVMGVAGKLIECYNNEFVPLMEKYILNHPKKNMIIIPNDVLVKLKEREILNKRNSNFIDRNKTLGGKRKLEGENLSKTEKSGLDYEMR